MSDIIEKYSRALKLYRDDGISVPVLPSEMRTLIAEFLALKEHCAALESREVCTVAHEDVETCGYCQRDALQRQNQHLLTVTKQQARRIESMEAGLTPKGEGCPLCGRTDPHSHTAGPMGMS